MFKGRLFERALLFEGRLIESLVVRDQILKSNSNLLLRGRLFKRILHIIDQVVGRDKLLVENCYLRG